MAASIDNSLSGGARSKRFVLRARQFYALVWKDVVVHKRHLIWSLLELTIPVLVCALAILSAAHMGRPKLEPERTFDQDDYEKLFGDLSATKHRLLIAPNTSFTRALIQHIDEPNVRVELVSSEQILIDTLAEEIPVALNQVKKLIPDDTANSTFAGVVVEQSREYWKPNVNQQSTSSLTSQSSSSSQSFDIPLDLRLAVRATNFRLNPEALPKKSSLGPFLHGDHYTSTFFMAAQIIVSRAYISLVAHQLGLSADLVPAADNIVGQRLPYPRFVAHKRLRDSTLSTFVVGAQKQKPFVLTLDFCVTIGFLVTAIFLAKRLVDERKSRIRDMLSLVGVPNWLYYASHLTNTLLLMLIQDLLIVFLFDGGHIDAPQQNVQATLMYAILALYSLMSVVYVIALASFFKSSTRAIVCTALVWLGAPEVIERVFKLNAGVIESAGFVDINEQHHLLLAALSPNYALRLAGRLLTEADIYGEFYAKKQVYGEYRAIWSNINTPLPLYKSITLFKLILAMIISTIVYASIVYARDLLSKTMTASGEAAPSASLASRLVRLAKLIVTFIVALILSPFKIARAAFDLFCASTKATTTAASNNLNNNNNRRSSLEAAAYANSAFVLMQQQTNKQQQQQQQQETSNNEQQQMQMQDNYDDGYDGDDVAFKSSSKYFELAPKMLRVGLKIRNVCKTYTTRARTIEAVKDVSLDLYYSQILVLLGHNGAGKTTLIDIIGGHNYKTAGKIFINGIDIDTQPQAARQQVGYCPQIDIIFDKLTVYEHLYFYGIVKGSSGSKLQTEIRQLLEQSGLACHKQKLAKNLSGGYKRKLSLAIAMIAHSKLLILDEPTSGMDPESRRKVWDFLQLIRNERLILMTTHHMEEADALSDRIAIMSSGQVRCCGSALFLKRAFDAGYHLRICKSLESWNQVAFDELIAVKHKLNDSSKLENETPHELMFKFSVSETATLLPPLFDDLEKYKQRVGIFGFGITVSTMDDVFMKLATHFPDHLNSILNDNNLPFDDSIDNNYNNQSLFNSKKQQRTKLNMLTTKSDLNNGNIISNKLRGVSTITESALSSVSSIKRLNGKQLFRQQLRALIAKRAQHTRKNWLQLAWILAISLACVVSIVVLLDYVIFKEEITQPWSRALTLPGAGYGPDTRPLWQFAAETPPEEVSSASSVLSDGLSSEEPSTSPSSSISTPTSNPTTTTTTTTTAINNVESSTTTQASTNSAITESSLTTTLTPLSNNETPEIINNPVNDSSSSSIPTDNAELTTTIASATSMLTNTEAVDSTTVNAIDRNRRQLLEKQAQNMQTLALTQSSTSELSSSSIEIPKPSSSPLIDTTTVAFKTRNDSEAFLQDLWLPNVRDNSIGGASGQLLTYSDINTEMIDLLTREFADFREHYVIGGEKFGNKYIAWYNGEATHSFPISMNVMLNSILKQIWSTNNQVVNSTSSKPNFSDSIKNPRIFLKHVAMAQINTLIAFLPQLGRLINLIFLPFSLAFITSYFVIFPTHERVTKSKHLQLMTGVSTRTFWLAHFLFDLALYMAYTVMLLAIYFVWDRVLNDRRLYFANFEHSVALVALVVLFVFAALPMAYIFSFIAKKPTSAFSSFCVLTILTGTATLTLVSLYELKYESQASASTKIIFTVFLSLARLIPSVSLLTGLQKLFALNSTRAICINISHEVLDLVCKYINSPIVDDELQVLKPHRCCRGTCANECFDQWPFFWTGWFGVNVELAMLVFDAALLWFILVLIECKSIRQAICLRLSFILCCFDCCLPMMFRGKYLNQSVFCGNSDATDLMIDSQQQKAAAGNNRVRRSSLLFSTSPFKVTTKQTSATLQANNINGNKLKTNDNEKNKKSSVYATNILDSNNSFALSNVAQAKPSANNLFGLISKYSAYSWQVPVFNEKSQQMKDEQMRVSKILANNQTDEYAMIVENLRKVYSQQTSKQPIVAVDDLSFAVDKREFFGLLGVNGAGKSTTFKTLTGEIKLSAGNAHIGNADVKTQRREYLTRIGYCPQQDALIDQMTGNEMLTLFAKLRGIPALAVERLVAETLRSLGLEKLANVNCNNYSGGNKRRLSVGMALIGSPEVIFLDEPTSGVDPMSRRKMWATLINYQKKTNSCFVMTSHSMNECESLCDRVAIMVGGQFKVLGSIQYLRTCLSQGYSLVLKVKPQKLNKLSDLNNSSKFIDEYMKQKLQLKDDELKLRDVHQTVIDYHIKPSAKLTWSRMLTLLEQAKHDLDLEDYQITSDASLESIFLSLAKGDKRESTTNEQKEEEEDQEQHADANNKEATQLSGTQARVGKRANRACVNKLSVREVDEL